MRPILFALPLLALAACETPRQACINDVGREINIDRGFAVEVRQESREINTTCRGVTESGEEVRVRCEEVRVRDLRVPVTIDLDQERIKLRQLEERLASLQAKAQREISQCQALYPEG